MMLNTAFIFAAGKGERMLPLTANLPKPLLKIASKELIVWHLERLAQQGIKQVIININYLGELIQQRLGDGSEWGLEIIFSTEEDFIETGGALLWAQEQLSNEPFYIISADIWLEKLPPPPKLNSDDLAHLYLVKNPQHHPEGDFYFNPLSQRLSTQAEEGLTSYTFSGLGCLNPSIYSQEFLTSSLGYLPTRGDAFKLAPLLRTAIKAGKVTAQLLPNHWVDVGTPHRLEELNALLSV